VIAELVALLDDPVRRRALIAAGRVRADEFSMAVVAERFVAVYERVLAATPTPESHIGAV